MNKTLSKFLAQQASYVYDPVKWAYDILHFECDKWQEEGLRDLVDKRFCAWSTCTGAGKSANLSIATWWFLCTRPFPKVPATAPSQHQLYDVLWAEHSKWQRRSEMLSRMFTWTQTRIGLKGHEEEWFSVARTSRPKPGEAHAEGLQGFHAGHLLFIVDEASAVHDSIFSAVDGAFTTPDSYAILASNPTRRSGYFFRQIVDPANSVYAVKFVSAHECKMVTKESIDLAIRKYGQDSDFYRTKVLGLPPLLDFAALISDEQIVALHDREVIPSDTDSVVASCDPARFGDDFTIIYVRKGNRIIDRISLKSMDTMQVAGLLLDTIKTHKAKTVLIDVIGIGSGVADKIRMDIRKGKLNVNVVDVNVAEKAVNTEQFANKRAEMFWHLRARINDISIPFDTPLLNEELVSIRYSAESLIKMEKKEELKRVIGRSPNDADALALLFYNEVLHNEVTASPTYFRVGAPTQQGIMTAAPQSIIEHQQFESSSSSPLGRRAAVVGGKRYTLFNTNGSFVGPSKSRFSIM